MYVISGRSGINLGIGRRKSERWAQPISERHIRLPVIYVEIVRRKWPEKVYPRGCACRDRLMSNEMAGSGSMWVEVRRNCPLWWKIVLCGGKLFFVVGNCSWPQSTLSSHKRRASKYMKSTKKYRPRRQRPAETNKKLWLFLKNML